MQKLFENFRRYINEVEESPESVLRRRFDQEAYDQLPREQWASDLDQTEELPLPEV
jgi:hypothetical protein